MRFILIFLFIFNFSTTILSFPKDSLITEEKKAQAKIYREEGYRLQSMGNLQEAMSFYQKAVELDPTYVEAINDLGVVYEMIGDLDSAFAMYKKALEIDSNYLPAYTNLGFLCEKRGDIMNATYYWSKRYELGKEGEYWREVAAQHLLQLGTYPEVKRAMQEKEAIRLSKELVYTREQQRLKILEEAKLHFDIGSNLLSKGDYSQALKEFDTALSLNPPDQALKIKIAELRKKAFILAAKNEALNNINLALADLKNDDYLSAGEKLKNALSAVFKLVKEK